VRAGDVVELQVSANPHVWYSPGYVDQIKSAMLSVLKETRLDASADFDAQAAGLDHAFATYHNLISQIAGQFGKPPVRRRLRKQVVLASNVSKQCHGRDAEVRAVGLLCAPPGMRSASTRWRRYSSCRSASRWPAFWAGCSQYRSRRFARIVSDLVRPFPAFAGRADRAPRR